MKRFLLLLNLFWCLLGGCITATTEANAQDFSRWRFYADITVHPQADDSFDAVYTDFSRLLHRDLKLKEALNETSLRVALLETGKPGAPVPSRFIKDKNYDALNNACGTLVFEVKGTPEAGPQTYRVFFDTRPGDYGQTSQRQNTVPDTANMVWNGGFEILSENYRGSNRYANAGENLPRGWWGNLRNHKALGNLNVTARSGQRALAFVAPEEGKNAVVSGSPSPPALRVLPGQDYRFSFWVKGEGLSPAQIILAASVYWFDKDQKPLPRIRIAGLPLKVSQFPWTQSEVTLLAPPEAHYGGVRVTTYSTTGYIAIDDIEMRLAVPPLLKNAQLNG